MSILARPQRYAFNSQLRIQIGSTTFETPVTSISANSLFIETQNPLLAGATFAASLMVDPPLQMFCTVSRVDLKRGMALRIAFGSREDDKRFTRLVGKLSETRAR